MESVEVKQKEAKLFVTVGDVGPFTFKSLKSVCLGERI